MKDFSFIIKLGRDIKEDISSVYKSIRKDKRLLVAYHNFHPEPMVFKRGNKLLVVLGRPICGERIDYETASNILLGNEISKHEIAMINGSFLFILYEAEGSKECLAGSG